MRDAYCRCVVLAATLGVGTAASAATAATPVPMVGTAVVGTGLKMPPVADFDGDSSDYALTGTYALLTVIHPDAASQAASYADAVAGSAPDDRGTFMRGDVRGIPAMPALAARRTTVLPGSAWRGTAFAIVGEIFALGVDGRGALRRFVSESDFRPGDGFSLAIPGTRLSLTGGSLRVRRADETRRRPGTSFSVQLSY